MYYNLFSEHNNIVAKNNKELQEVFIMLKKNARQNVEETCTNLTQIRQNLSDAATTVENQNTKAQIQNQLSSVENCLNECENIAQTLRQE